MNKRVRVQRVCHERGDRVCYERQSVDGRSGGNVDRVQRQNVLIVWCVERMLDL